MAHSNGIITAPVGLTSDVESVLGNGNHDLGTICLKNNINFWARYRPTGGGRVKNRKKDDSTNEVTSVMYGLATLDANGNAILKPINQILPLVQNINGNFNTGLVWNIKPDLKYYRLQDFNGYNNNATINYTYEFFKDAQRGRYNGVFYNDTVTILTLNRDTQYSSQNPPPQCWEESSSGADFSYCSRLYFEELFDNAGGLTNLYFGLAFIINSNSYLLSTGKTIGNLMNTNVSLTDIVIDNVTVGSIISNNGRVSLQVNFRNLGSIANPTFATGTSDIQIKARAVLINSGSSTPFIRGNFDNTYSFEVENNFCAGNYTLKFLAPYVNIRDVRNYGEFYSSDTTGNINYEYAVKNNIYDWYLKSGRTERSFSDQNYLTCDNITYTVNGTSCKRYRIKLGGFVCSEFRVYNVNDPYFIFDSTQVAGANVNIKLINDSGIGILKLEYGSNSMTNVPNEFIIGNENYLWSQTNVTISIDGTTQLRYCNYRFNDETGNYKYCHSEMFSLNSLVINNTNYNTDTVIYFYVPTTAVQSDLSAFHFKIKYTGVYYDYEVGQVAYKNV